MINICNPDSCSACNACSNICPKNAIQLKHNDCGFLVAHVDQEKCIDCGLCSKTCHINSSSALNKPLDCFAAIRKNKKERLDSASGGISSLLYEKFLERAEKPIAYGVSYNTFLIPTYISIKEYDDISQTRGSKYIYSNMGSIYKDIENELKKSKKVLFTGLPCQVSGLKNYLAMKKINLENIYFCDIFCHGVSSEVFFLQEIDYYKKKYHISSINNVTFRSNRNRKNFRLVLYGNKANGKRISKNFLVDEDYYFYGFLKEGLTLRESCYTCKYSTNARAGDISLGDFIGLGTNAKFGERPKEFDYNSSCILINSKKGFELLDMIKDECVITKRKIEEAVDGGSSLKKPYEKSPKREQFIKCFRETHDFIYSIEKASNHHIKKYRMTHAFIKWAKDFYALNIKKRKRIND